MPIIWKSSFEDPLLELLNSGQVGNSKKLVDSIVSLYDLSIKQGLPNSPGTPAGPVQGNRLALQNALMLYFKSESVIAQKNVIKIYTALLASIYSTIKNYNSEIISLTKQLQTNSRNISSINKKILEYSKLDSKQAKLKVIELKEQQTKLVKNGIDINKELILKKSYVINTVKPRIDSITEKLKSLVKRIVFPQLQQTKLTSIKSIPKYLSSNFSDIKSKKKEFVNEINGEVTSINTNIAVVSKSFKSLKKEDVSKAKQYATSVIKSNSKNTMVAAGNQLIGLIDLYPVTAIPEEQKAAIRTSVNSIIDSKSKIAYTKSYARNYLKEKLVEYNKSIIGTFKPKFLNDSLVSQYKQDSKEVQSAFKEYKNTIKVNTLYSSAAIKVKSELKSIKSNAGAYIPDASIGSLLDTIKPGSSSQYLSITSNLGAKRFLYGFLVSIISLNAISTLNKSKIRDNIKGIRNKLVKKKFNIKQIKFNAFLRQGLIGYWTGATTPNLGIVTSSGVLIDQVKLVSSANSEQFVLELSKAFQSHAKTVTGTYTIPGTPPVVLPWVGYT